MSETSWTPGPWEWVKSNDRNWPSYDLSPGILTKDTADGTPFGDEIDRANANLIAAAPDLYEALERMKTWCEDEVGAELPCDSINAALAKARGETQA